MSEFKGKVREITTALNARRKTDKEQISLRQYMGEAYPERQVEHLYRDLGIEPQRTRFEALFADDDTAHLAAEIVLDGITRGMGIAARQQRTELQAMLASLGSSITADPAARWLIMEQFLDPVRQGSVQDSFYQDLIIDDVPTTSDSVKIPKINLSDAEPKETGEVATIEVGTVEYGDKTVPLTKYARGLKISYEALRRHALNFVSIYFEDLGRRFGSALNRKLILAGVNGDQADLSESAATIGVTTANSFAYEDVTRAFIRMGLLGRTPNAIIASEAMANKWLNLPEVKNRQNVGDPVLMSMLKTKMPNMLDIYVSPSLSATQLMLVSASQAFCKLTELPMMLESDKVISKQLVETYASTVTGFATIQRDARLIIDESVTIIASPFPAWLAVN